MTDPAKHPRRAWRPSSPAWILVPLCASVVAYYPALPVSLVLTLVTLVIALLTPPGAPYRRRYLWGRRGVGANSVSGHSGRLLALVFLLRIR